jgi:hypothetical protein
MLLRMRFPEFRLANIWDVVGEADEGAAGIAVGQRQPQRLEHRIGEIEAEREQSPETGTARAGSGWRG